MAKVTLTDISHETGYSLATVSRVINSVGIVKPETREQVIAAAVKLGYAIPAGAEAQPSTTPGDVILVCLPTLGNPFYEDVVAGIRKSAQNHGYNVLIREGSINVKTLPSVLSAISSSCTAGVITMDRISVEVLKSISAKVPVVQCCEYNSLANLPYVSVDDYRIGECAVEHLASIGKKRIALLNGPITCKYAQHRLTGFLDTMRRLNLPEDSSMVINLSDILPDLAFSAALHLMKSGNPPDAFFTSSDIFALAIIRAATSSGYRVPQDIAVIGVDNISLLAFSTPSITTVNQPKLQLGATAGELLAERIRNPEAPIKQITLDPELIVRESA